MRRLALLAAMLLLSPPAPASIPQRSIQRSVKTYVAWSPYNFPSGIESKLDSMRGVEATTVLMGLRWMTSGVAGDGRVLERAPSGYGYPIEVAYVKPWEYDDYVDAQDELAVRGLEDGRALMSNAERRLRADGIRRLRFTRGRSRVTGTILTSSAQGYELVMRAPAPKGSQYLRSILIHADSRATAQEIRQRIRRSIPEGRPFKVISSERAEFLRYADGVIPQVFAKRAFGEFAGRPNGSSIVLDPSWRNRHITSRSVPILGTVTCHRRIFDQLRGALRELRRKGLSGLVRPSEYRGCFNSRFTTTGLGVRISRHSIGVALDINASGNCFGCEPHQDPRLVRIMKRWGFTWGGLWPAPDGMHFEWARFP